LNPEPLS